MEIETQTMESPDYLRTSLAAAMTLDFRPGLFYRNARLHCINLLMTYAEGCRGNCAYCGLSREREVKENDQTFIRVDWPTYSLDEVVERIAAKGEDRIRRICVSMITNRRAVEDLKMILRRIRARLDTPVSLLVTPTILEPADFEAFKELGADRIGVAIDAATPELFARWRGQEVKGPHQWDQYWETFETALGIFGADRAGVHLIVGLGETEEEMVRAIQRAKRMGGGTHLFSFFPEAGSQMDNRDPPPMGQYRRMQLARFLIDEGIADGDGFRFDEEGRLTDFGMSEREVMEVVETGVPFMTSGCPDGDGEVACNRPYGNSPPGPDLRNYPFRPNEDDVERVKTQLWT